MVLVAFLVVEEIKSKMMTTTQDTITNMITKRNTEEDPRALLQGLEIMPI